MRAFLLITSGILAFSFTIWQSDFETAKKIAQQKHCPILLNFSGSDWCGPCMRLKKEILEDQSFAAMADSSLVLVNADFPRNKKNQLAPALKKQNDALADKYNPEGNFPYTLLLDENGKILKTWDGMPTETAAQFTNEIKNYLHAGK